MNGYFWLTHAFSFWAFTQGLDVLTTWFGMELGLKEMGIAPSPVIGSYGIFGLVALKIGVTAALGAGMALVYFGVKHYRPENLNRAAKIMALSFLFAALVSLVPVVSNLSLIHAALHTKQGLTFL